MQLRVGHRVGLARGSQQFYTGRGAIIGHGSACRTGIDGSERASIRIEHDSMGELQVPADALYGAQTQRAVDNFPISGLPMPREFIRALGLIKAAAARGRMPISGHLQEDAARRRSARRAERVAAGEYDAHFPIDIFQTGSGTSTQHECERGDRARWRAAAGAKVHPNDDVNIGQSSNDVIPTAIQVSAALTVSEQLLPALKHLQEDDRAARARARSKIAKTGRTHLMDAMPVTFGQELGGWAAQIALEHRAHRATR